MRTRRLFDVASLAYQTAAALSSGLNSIGAKHAAACHMPHKPYEIKVRVFAFACDVIRAFPRTRLDTPSIKLWSQVIASATSAGAHLEEAAAGGSRAQFLALVRGALREMRESHYWLRLMTATHLSGADKITPLVEESRELVAILTTIARNTEHNGPKPPGRT